MKTVKGIGRLFDAVIAAVVYSVAFIAAIVAGPMAQYYIPQGYVQVCDALLRIQAILFEGNALDMAYWAIQTPAIANVVLGVVAFAVITGVYHMLTD